MAQLLQNVSSPDWWLSVFVVSVAIELASNYLQRYLDTVVSQISGARKRAIEKDRQLFDEKVRRLLSNPVSTIELRLDMLYSTVIGFSSVILGLIIGASSAVPAYSNGPRDVKIASIIVLSMLAAVCMVVAVIQGKHYFDSGIFLSEVLKRREKVSGS